MELFSEIVYRRPHEFHLSLSSFSEKNKKKKHRTPFVLHLRWSLEPISANTRHSVRLAYAKKCTYTMQQTFLPTTVFSRRGYLTRDWQLCGTLPSRHANTRSFGSIVLVAFNMGDKLQPSSEVRKAHHTGQVVRLPPTLTQAKYKLKRVTVPVRTSLPRLHPPPGGPRPSQGNRARDSKRTKAKLPSYATYGSSSPPHSLLLLPSLARAPSPRSRARLR